ncbi:hypothetical protein T4E_5544 [Trichinella pseudospiralis]|uniref:Uncharacterized protein n=1 Tax=Trichinella pseudospiralis TaxID=6337 RepID=A0A0V0XZC9_TRIPS|nr:hypothetical protein T4E_5544 [Trichinella pseudospiralis]
MVQFPQLCIRIKITKEDREKRMFTRITLALKILPREAKSFKITTGERQVTLVEREFTRG